MTFARANLCWIEYLGSDGIHIIHDQQGRPSGEAFIEFASAADLDEALKNDRQSFGSRYVEGE